MMEREMRMPRGWNLKLLGCIVSGLAAAMLASLACAQANVALVNRVSGAATYAAGSGAPNPVTAFMRVREGDSYRLERGAQVRVVYMQGGRQETWTGPAAFRAGEKQSSALRGTPEVSQVPVMVAAKLGRLPDLMQSARLGGVTVRGRPGTMPLTAEEVDDLRVARENYRQLRASAAQEDDITAEMFLFSVLQEYGQFEELKGVAREMRRRQLDSAEVRELAEWAESRGSSR